MKLFKPFINLLVFTISCFASFSIWAQPKVQNFSPKSTVYGGEVNIYGSGFTNVDSITFGGITAVSYQTLSSSWIKAYPGEGLSGYVAVYTNTGVDSMPGFTYLNFPSFSSFTPASGGLGTEITIKGQNLINTWYVNVGNTSVPMLVRNDTMVVIKLTRAAFGNIAFAFSGKIINTDFFFDYTGPIVSEIKPTLVKKGTRVVITGSAFGNLQEVRFGNLPGIDVVKTNDNRIEATVPEGIKNDTVYTLFDNGLGFGLVIPAPMPSPIQYTGKRGDTLWLTGDNLIPASGVSKVRIGSRSASIIRSRRDSLQVIVPQVADYGPVSLINRGDYLTTFPRAFISQHQPAMPVNGSTFASADFSSLYGLGYNLLMQTDLNNDGREDYIAYKSDSLFALRHQGYGAAGNNLFNPFFIRKLNQYPEVYLTDWNNDGWQDILLNGYASLTLLENQSRYAGTSLSFANYGTIISQQSNQFRQVLTGDINAQGSHSIIIMDNIGKIFLYKNKWLPLPMPGESISTGYQLISSFNAPLVFSQMELSDLDGDGLPEILAIASDEMNLYIYKNISKENTLAFSSPTLLPLPEKPRSFTPADINMDGSTDLLVSYTNMESKTIMMRNTTQPGQPFSFISDRTILHPRFIGRQIRLLSADGDNLPDLLVLGSQRVETLSNYNFEGSFGFIENKSQPGGNILTDTLKSFLLSKSADMPGHLGVRINTGDRVFVTDENNDGKPDFLTNYGYIFRNKAGEKPVLYHSRPARPILRDTIDIVGYNLSGVYDVSFGNTKAVIHFASDTLLRVSLQSYEGGNIKITNHFGSDSMLSPIIIQVPEITGISPKVVNPGGQVTIKGKYFNSTPSVRTKIGNVWVPVLNNTDTTITLTIPYGAISGKLAVLANGLYGFSKDWLLVSQPSGISSVKTNDFLLLDSIYAGRQVPIRSLQITSLNGRDKNDLFLKQDSSFKNYYDYTITKLQPVVLQRQAIGQKQLYSRVGLPSTTPYENNDIAWEDLDGNGYPDMFVGIDSDIDNSLLFINKGGDGKLFKNPIQSKDIIWNGPWDFFKADFDMNGRIDIGYRPGQSYGLSLFINTVWKDSIILRKETFSQYISWYMRYAKPDDIDQDGKTDMAWVQYHANSARQIHFNRNNSDSGMLKLSTSTEVFGGEENTTIMDFAMAPIFQDYSSNELILVRRMDLTTGGMVEFFKKNLEQIPGYYNPYMAKAFGMPLQYKPLFMKLADADGDGRLDVLAFLRNPAIETNEQLITHMAVLRNTSQGTDYNMASPVYIALPARATSAEVADMDEDGKPDILLGGVNGYITVLKNFIGLPKPRIVCPGETIVLNEVPAGASSFQWQVSVDSWKTFSNITPGGFYAGENTGQLTIAGITTSLYGNIYKCVTNAGTLPGTMIKISHSWKTNAPDNQWENAANWSCGSVPEGMTDVFIPTGANVRVNSQASCRSITLATGATVTLQTGAQLNVLK